MRLSFVSPDEFATESEEQARVAEAAGVPRRDAQLVGDLTKRQPEPAKSMNRYQVVEATVPLGIRVQLINESKLAMPPGSGFWQDAFDKRPRSFQFLVREVLRSRPPSSWSWIRREVVSAHVVSAMRPSNRL
jgi:hypothetical protein